MGRVLVVVVRRPAHNLASFILAKVTTWIVPQLHLRHHQHQDHYLYKRLTLPWPRKKKILAESGCPDKGACGYCDIPEVDIDKRCLPCFRHFGERLF